MGKYRNKFKVGDYVVCNANYSWIRRGTTYQVKAVNRTGSIQLHGSSGNYNPDKFYLAQQIEEAATEDNSIYIAICVDGRYPDINTFIADCIKDFIPVKLTNSTKFRIGTKSELEENLKKDFENDPTFGKYPTSQQWIFALLDSTMELSTQLSPVVVSKTKDF